MGTASLPHCCWDDFAAYFVRVALEFTDETSPVVKWRVKTLACRTVRTRRIQVSLNMHEKLSNKLGEQIKRARALLNDGWRCQAAWP